VLHSYSAGSATHKSWTPQISTGLSEVADEGYNTSVPFLKRQQAAPTRQIQLVQHAR
jgi:hypothetical protein